MEQSITISLTIRNNYLLSLRDTKMNMELCGPTINLQNGLPSSNVLFTVEATIFLLKNF